MKNNITVGAIKICLVAIITLYVDGVQVNSIAQEYEVTSYISGFYPF